MPPHLRLQLLQEFRLWLDDQPVDGPYQPRLQSLVAYLALHANTPQPRSQIAYLLWPDSSDQQAQTNLRKLIHTLRQHLPDPDRWLFLDHRHLGWQKDVQCVVDVAEVEATLDRLAQGQKGGGSEAATLLQKLTHLYTGELLPASYEEWVLARRRELHERVINVLAGAMAELETAREYKTGIDFAETLLRLDPLHEGALHYLILFRALSGNRAGALRAYQEGALRLEQELDVSPADETQALYQQLLQEGLSPEPPPFLAQPNQPPMVGRQREWQALLAAWRQISQRGPQLLLIWGEAGMGKTRLAEEFQQWAGVRAGTVAYAHLYDAEGSLPYAPVTLWLRHAALRQTLTKLEPLWLTELIRLLPEVLHENPALPLPAPMNEGWQQQRFYEALARVIAAAPAPRLLLLDDVQWCDGETLRWLRYLLRFDPKLPLLIVGTVRNEALDSEHPLHALLHQLQRTGQYTELELQPLDAEETARLARSLAEEEESEWIDQIYAETEGNPLFIVETVRARLSAEINEQAQSPLPPAIPMTIQAVIAARLAHLTPAAQQMVELAATIGRTFVPTVLAAAAECDEERVAQGLDELWRRRILRAQNDGYNFSHDKIREVAYAALAPMQRRQLHRKVAESLEAIYGADPATDLTVDLTINLTVDLTTVWGQLAIHYEAAQMPTQALPYLIRLAQQAESLDAFAEADAYYTRALTLHNAQLPVDRRGTLDLLLMRAARLDHQGQSAGRNHEIETMLALASALGEPELLATAHLRQASYLSATGNSAAALRAGEEALAITRAHHDKMGEIQALRELGLICWSAQEYGDALRYGREVLLLHRQQSDVSGEATALHNLAEIYRSLGSPRQAITLYEEALQLYWGRREHRRQALTLYSLAYAYRQTARFDEALRHYEQARAFCERVGDRLILSRICHALAILHWEMEQGDAAVQAMSEAIEISRAIGYLQGIAYGLVAQGYMEAQLDRRALAFQHLQAALVSLNLMGDEEGAREVQQRVELLTNGAGELAEPPPALQWIRSHVVLTEGKVYCEFELPATVARRGEEENISRRGAEKSI